MHVRALCLQFQKQTLAVWLARDKDSRLPTLESGCDEASYVIEKMGILRIESHLVMPRGLRLLCRRERRQLVGFRRIAGRLIRRSFQAMPSQPGAHNPLG